MKKVLILIGIAFLVSCKTTETSFPSNCLAGNPKLPDRELIDFYGRTQWKEMRVIPYDGYVIFRGSVDRNGNFVQQEVLESFPSEAGIARASRFAEEISVSSGNQGSRIRPTIEVFVVFYETHSTPNKALVFSRKKGSASSGGSLEGSYYMRIWTYSD